MGANTCFYCLILLLNRLQKVNVKQVVVENFSIVTVTECNQARKTVWGFKTSATIYLEYMQVITIWDLPELSIQLNASARVSLCLTPVCCTSCLPLSATPSRPVSWLLIPRWTSKVWKASEPEAVSSPLLFRNSRSK